MKNLLEGMVIAFAMYSKIPMPRVEWEKENMRYALCFFPLVGVSIGLLVSLWKGMQEEFAFGTLLFACIGAVIPVLVTGGIHLDGFLDTVDALSAYASQEKRLEILKDPHTGAFAIIFIGVYFAHQEGIIFLCHLVNDRGHHFAGHAPGRPEVHQNLFVCIHNLIKIFCCNRNNTHRKSPF